MPVENPSKIDKSGMIKTEKNGAWNMTVKHQKIAHYKTCLNWLTAKRAWLAEMTDQWAQDERRCREEWTYYLAKLSRYREAVEADFDALCAGMTDDQRREVLAALKTNNSFASVLSTTV